MGPILEINGNLDAVIYTFVCNPRIAPLFVRRDFVSILYTIYSEKTACTKV